MARLIELRDIYKIYSEGLESEVRALNGVSLDIDRGEFVAVVGQSGSGKSTLMNVLGCLDIPTYGTYLLDGVDVGTLSDNQLSKIRNREIGFIFQNSSRGRFLVTAGPSWIELRFQQYPLPQQAQNGLTTGP